MHYKLCWILAIIWDKITAFVSFKPLHGGFTSVPPTIVGMEPRTLFVSTTSLWKQTKPRVNQSYLILYRFFSIILNDASLAIKLLFLQFKWFVFLNDSRYKIAERSYSISLLSAFKSLALVAAAATYIMFEKKSWFRIWVQYMSQ